MAERRSAPLARSSMRARNWSRIGASRSAVGASLRAIAFWAAASSWPAACSKAQGLEVVGEREDGEILGGVLVLLAIEEGIVEMMLAPGHSGGRE